MCLNACEVIFFFLVIKISICYVQHIRSAILETLCLRSNYLVLVDISLCNKKWHQNLNLDFYLSEDMSTFEPELAGWSKQYQTGHVLIMFSSGGEVSSRHPDWKHRSFSTSGLSLTDRLRVKDVWFSLCVVYGPDLPLLPLIKCHLLSSVLQRESYYGFMTELSQYSAFYLLVSLLAGPVTVNSLNGRYESHYYYY